jgi:eukaryotic-like serine/threonine-protein kinase
MSTTIPPPVPSHRKRLASGRYELIEVAGRGGMATVWRGVLIGPGRFRRTVAVKHMYPNLAERALFCEMFFEEARIGSILQDPNIPQVYELLVEGADHYLVMEFIDGIDLGTFIYYVTGVLGQSTRWDLVAAIGIGMLRGLAVAHERVTADGRAEPIIHRDVSPHNVLISAGGPAKLIDFGLCLTADRDFDATDPGIAKGKLAYLAPEVAGGEPTTPASDQFAAGSVLWEALVGHRLFGDADPYAVYHRLRAGDVPPLRKARPDIPKELAAVVHRALALEPSDRFASARDMAKQLGDVLKASTSAEDLYASLARTVSDARADLAMGSRTQREATESPIPELDSGLVELEVEEDLVTGLKRFIPVLFNRLRKDR